MLQYKKMRNKVVKRLRDSKQKFISNIAYQNLLEICETFKQKSGYLQCSDVTFAASDRDKANNIMLKFNDINFLLHAGTHLNPL